MHFVEINGHPLFYLQIMNGKCGLIRLALELLYVWFLQVEKELNLFSVHTCFNIQIAT